MKSAAQSGNYETAAHLEWTAELLKRAIGPVSAALHQLFIKVWRSGMVPADWRLARWNHHHTMQKPATCLAEYSVFSWLRHA